MYVVKDNLHWRFVGVNYNLCFFFFFLRSDSQFRTILQPSWVLTNLDFHIILFDYFLETV